jgi:carboxylesterase type B
MKSTILPLLWATLVNSAAIPNVPVAANVHGLGVTYKGIYQNEIEGFLGIRYALDTSNENRFRPPVPFNPVPKHTYNANKPVRIRLFNLKRST